MSFRLQPERDAFIVQGMAAVQLDPPQATEYVVQQDPSRRISSKIGMDATRKLE